MGWIRRVRGRRARLHRDHGDGVGGAGDVGEKLDGRPGPRRPRGGPLGGLLLDAGIYDAIVSIEMIESIPRTRWDQALPRARGPARSGRADRPAGDHGCGPALGVLGRESRLHPPLRVSRGPGALARRRAGRRAAAGLRTTAMHGYGSSYALTLAEWRRRFDAAWARHRRSRVRRALQTDVAVLPLVLRGRVPGSDVPT